MRFVLFDRLVEMHKGERAVFQKSISQAEDYFIDHFSGYPVVPGSIILGSFEQGAEIFLAASANFTLRPVLKAVERATFRRPLVPGEQLRISVSSLLESPGKVKAVGEVEGERVAEASLSFDFTSAEDAREACARLKALYETVVTNPLERMQQLWRKGE